ncbi:MAG: TIGR03750 family conjugal transfer protein [Gammaproteobacteria bacterium]|nr:TIGR03750 family conjugal transfer protein [Gammaproteobacteria bacterium]
MALLKDTAHRIDKEPVLFLGCSGKEIFALAVAGALTGLILGTVLGFITGLFFLMMPSLFIGAFISVWKGGKVMMHKKEGKPEGYYGKVILSWLSNQGFMNLFINRSGFWSIRK